MKQGVKGRVVFRRMIVAPSFAGGWVMSRRMIVAPSFAGGTLGLAMVKHEEVFDMHMRDLDIDRIEEILARGLLPRAITPPEPSGSAEVFAAVMFDVWDTFFPRLHTKVLLRFDDEFAAEWLAAASAAWHVSNMLNQQEAEPLFAGLAEMYHEALLLATARQMAAKVGPMCIPELDELERKVSGRARLIQEWATSIMSSRLERFLRMMAKSRARLA